METTGQLYFDPFAEAGEQLFDPMQAFAAIEEQYQRGEIRHRADADEFVRASEALMLDAWFVNRLDAVQAIASRLHQSCAGDGHLGQSLQASELFAGITGIHAAGDGHDHDHEPAAGHEHHDDDDDEIDPKTGKRIKKKRRSWFGVYR